MRLNFAAGLVVGVLLASVIVLGTTYSQGPSRPAPEFTVAATTTVATTSSSTTTASSTSQVTSVPAAVAPTSNLSASLGGLQSSISNAATQGTSAFVAGTEVQPPSSLAVVARQPALIPLLLMPILLALGLGFVLYRATRQEE